MRLFVLFDCFVCSVCSVCSGVVGGTSLLLNGSTPLTAEQHEIVSVIRSSGEVMLTLINDILDLSKIEADKLELEHHIVDVRDVMEEAIDVIAAKAAEHGLDLVYHADQSVPLTMQTDLVRLRQVFVNLLSNAVVSYLTL